MKKGTSTFLAVARRKRMSPFFANRQRGLFDLVDVLFLLLAAAEDHDLRNLVVFGGDAGLNALVADLGEHFGLQPALDGVAGLELLVLLVELALHDLDVVGGGQRDLLTLFALLGALEHGDLVAVDLRDAGAELFSNGHAEAEQQDSGSNP